jgi:hypothetical protein
MPPLSPSPERGEVSSAPRLHIVPRDCGYTEVVTPIVRGFLGIDDAEPVELTFFCEGRILVAHATDLENHVRLLREAGQRSDFNGAYQLVNGPMDPALLARYESNRIHKAWNGRATDRDIGTRRAIFLDVDPKRPKGISSTDEQLKEAAEVADKVERFLAEALAGDAAIGRGCSGNGYFVLVALEPRPVAADDVVKISAFLRLLNEMFGTPTVKIDQAVANAARLMPAPGTWKRKGVNTPERPHRETSFCCRARVTRVPLESLTS